MTYLLLETIIEQESIRIIQSQFRVSKQKAKKDLEAYTKYLSEIIHPDGACPIHEMDFDILPPFKAQLSAPLRMDLALTYRCNNDCAHCYNARPRDYPELSTSAWYEVIDRIWDIGIPHVVFTGGEPTLRSDLTKLISYAEKKGLITGLNTNGRRLSDPTFLDTLLQSGLDHVQITIESHDPAIHDEIVGTIGAFQQTLGGLKLALSKSLFVMTNTTLLRQNSPYLETTLNEFASIGVPTIGLNALIHSGKGTTVSTGLNDCEMRPLLELAKDITAKHHQHLIWYTPTQYCQFDPMQLSLGVKGCTAALYNMCIEPDGGVIPCQSFYYQIGNILIDPWSEIWNHDLASSLRLRKFQPLKCTTCLIQSNCGGGCPLHNFQEPYSNDQSISKFSETRVNLFYR